MSLSNLKRKSPTHNSACSSVEEFIEGATAYANGENVIAMRTSPTGKSPQKAKVPMTRHCFTLDAEAKELLEKAATGLGISRSEIIRRCLKDWPQVN